MDRRNALRNLGILTGGMVLLPSCNFSEEKVSLVMNKLNIKTSEEALMKELVSCIIPEGDIPGAASLEVHNFVWIMVDDCMDDEKQASFLKGMKSFDSFAKEMKGTSFLSMQQSERENSLSDIISQASEDADPLQKDISFFVSAVKGLTSYGYMQSEYIMKEVMPYTLIPGSYGPCETVDNSKRINVNG
ncbi:gluconate 2-dehydrogenase subunit 3 family protein [Lutimonas halocynthiae]|uniref:gluconate 2-dehydrogenase subunit 3 family protein n=1 Tax=Lutimonas halocynthiae TaxID=1446477 RepID=UPI0025B607ED|nr:gluconate 2-dehydrogenase subunit 3 family protein [Lutimonas halocynthiae]MDN3642735.1 gluconate 2-dehydrogenase subunit 3 family protein [Lutimonas halocynthiae]